MYLSLISSLLQNISKSEFSEEDLCKHLYLKTLSPMKPSGLVISRVTTQGTLKIIEKFGFTSELDMKIWQEMPLEGSMPMCDAVVNDKLVWVDSLPHWPDEYFQLNSHALSRPHQTFIAWPVRYYGTPLAAVGLFSYSKIFKTAELEDFISTISSVLSLRIANLGLQLITHRTPSKEFHHKKVVDLSDSERFRALSPRQILILKLMKDEYTNQNIADQLGYSESTIRQETIKIYSILGVDGRKNAIEFYDRMTQEN